MHHGLQRIKYLVAYLLKCENFDICKTYKNHEIYYMSDILVDHCCRYLFD